MGSAPGEGLENVANGMLEVHDLGVGFPVFGAIELFDISMNGLQGMKDTVVMGGGGEEVGQQRIVLGP